MRSMLINVMSKANEIHILGCSTRQLDNRINLSNQP